MIPIPNGTTLGCSAVLRVAGLPIRHWLSAANPAFFAKIARLEYDEERRRAYAIHLAEQIGQQLVPYPGLSRRDRALILTLRRHLHRNDLIGASSLQRLQGLPGLTGPLAELVQAIVDLGNRDVEIATLLAEIDKELAVEQARLILLPERIRTESQVASVVLPVADADGARAGKRSSPRRRRHRFEHEWSYIERASTDSTPRGWFSQVALVPVQPPTSAAPLAVTSDFAVQWTDNIRSRRRAMTNPPTDWPASDTVLALNPLHWDAGEHLVSVVLDQHAEPTQVSVRRTSLLDAICTAFAVTARTFGELVQLLESTGEELHTLRGFVRHLVVLGILQPSAPPAIRLERMATPGPTTIATDVGADEGGWVDVYRYVENGIPGGLVTDLQRGATLALRVLGLIAKDAAPLHSLTVPTFQRSWSFAEILRAELDARDALGARHKDPDPADGFRSAPSSSGYATLVRAMVEQAGQGSELIFDSDLLNSHGVPDEVLPWPVDCLMRLPTQSANFAAVLEQFWPPGMLDARFSDTFMELHGNAPLVDTYREFLHRIEELTGILFVELLAPPLTDGAANAVRRPIYTSAWTGDPHPDMYMRGAAGRGRRYIPLSAIRLQRIEGRLRADVNGQLIWPIHHATRSFSPPWDRIAQILLATAPRRMPWAHQGLHSLMYVPEQTVMPRVSVSGGIILSPTQWLLPLNQFWDRSESSVSKIRALVRLRRRNSLPRWIYLKTLDVDRPIPCDLESIHAISMIEKCLKLGRPVRLVEMLPAPDQFLVLDRAHNAEDRLASQCQFRFPYDETPAAMASRVASGIVEFFGLPARAHNRSPAAPGCRDPPAIA